MPTKPDAVPRTIWALGFVSMFADISSEMIHSLLPVFLVAGLGASPALVGVIEGVAEATASITKVFSGWLSDRLGRRKWLTVVGYGLALVTKPIFPLAVTPYEVLAARFLDRIGKGIRDAPRDALVADVVTDGSRGAAYGVRQSLDTVGAVVGPLVAVGLMGLLHDNMRTVFAFAVIPAAVALMILIWAVRETPASRAPATPRPPVRWAEVKAIGAPFWLAVVIGALFTMARFSEAFLVLRGSGAGVPLAFVPVVLIAMNVVYALVSAPAGRLSDAIGRKSLLVVGIGVLILADLTLALSGQVAGVMVGVALWGLHMGLTQGLLSALVADTAPASMRGSAFGLFSLVTGVAALGASALAGALWSMRGAAWTFLAGGGFAVVALVGVIFLLKDKAADIAPAS